MPFFPHRCGFHASLFTKFCTQKSSGTKWDKHENMSKTNGSAMNFGGLLQEACKNHGGVFSEDKTLLGSRIPLKAFHC